MSWHELLENDTFRAGAWQINSSLGSNCKVTVINELVYEGKDFTEK